MSAVRLIGLISIACFALQAVVFSKSTAVAGNPVHCVVLPTPDCNAILASGYAVVLDGAGRDMNLAGAVAVFVPLLLIFTIVITAHNPSLRKSAVDGSSTSISTEGWVYGLLFTAILAYSAMSLT